MKAEYKRDLQNNYLILEVPDAEEDEDYGLRMAEQNQVKGLLPMHESRRDGKLYLHYEITSKQTLESVYEKKVMGYQDILYILSGICDTLEIMRKYLLSPQRLLFAPELIYVQPERKALLLCYYVKEEECPIRMLSEFILKRLDHRDRQAVALGYGFFEQASGENFSLAETLKGILTTFGGTAGTAALKASSVSDGGSFNRGVNGGYDAQENPDGTEMRSGTEDFTLYQEPYAVHWERGKKGERNGEDGKNDIGDNSSKSAGGGRSGKGSKSSKSGKGERLAEYIFSKVHPAVLLSLLALTAVLEILVIGGMLSLTECGGCFFLLLSVEILLNRRLLHKQKTVPEEWDEEEESEEYRKMLQEVYQDSEEEKEIEPIEETRCLIPKEEDRTLRLICCSDAESKEEYPEILPELNPIYIGKIRGEADVILNVSTVSRMHARIQVRQGQCYLKDISSKNGTFVNGRRLEPQEECEIQEGDTVAFAQIEYRVVEGSRPLAF